MSTQIPDHTFHRPLFALTALVVLAACAAIEEAAPPARVAVTSVTQAEVARAATLMPESPPITPRAPMLEESELADDSDSKPASGPLPTPALAALDAAPTPEVIASIHPRDSGVPPRRDAPESVLSHLGPTTPPNVAAAMRLIEEGRQQLAQGQYDQALERFERGVAIDPANAYGYYYLAQLYYQMQKYDQASAFAGRAVTLAMRTDRLWLARAYGLQGAVFEEVGHYAEARKAYQKAVQADPNNLAARAGVGRLSGGQ